MRRRLLASALNLNGKALGDRVTADDAVNHYPSVAIDVAYASDKEGYGRRPTDLPLAGNRGSPDGASNGCVIWRSRIAAQPKATDAVATTWAKSQALVVAV